MVDREKQRRKGSKLSWFNGLKGNVISPSEVDQEKLIPTFCCLRYSVCILKKEKKIPRRMKIPRLHMK